MTGRSTISAKSLTGREPIPLVPATRSEPISAVQALGRAYSDTLTLLFRPFDLGLWLRLGLICLLLGGGASWAAFNWILGSLPGDIGRPAFTGRMRDEIAAHLWLVGVLTAAALLVALALLYLRALFRFILVDAILRRAVQLRRVGREWRPLGRSYFRWLLAALAVVGIALVAGAFAAYPYLRAAAAGGLRSEGFWVTLIAVLLADVAVGLALAIVIVLTDDLAVPLMYAERLPLAAAWRKLGRALAAEPAAFALYVLLRFAVAVAAGAAILFFLIPVLLGLFSGAIITGALVVLALHLLGLIWSWNPFTIALAATGLGVLLGLTLVVLSVVGMPAQVFIQDYGMRFMSSRAPALGALFSQPESFRGREEG